MREPFLFLFDHEDQELFDATADEYERGKIAIHHAAVSVTYGKPDTERYAEHFVCQQAGLFYVNVHASHTAIIAPLLNSAKVHLRSCAEHLHQIFLDNLREKQEAYKAQREIAKLAQRRKMRNAQKRRRNAKSK